MIVIRKLAIAVTTFFNDSRESSIANYAICYSMPNNHRKLSVINLFEEDRALGWADALTKSVGLPPEKWSSLRYGFEP